MPVRKADAVWYGDLKGGNGKLGTQSGVLKDIAYNFVSRFEEGDKTNPEELLGAAHAGCFSMALANALSNAGFKVNSVTTSDAVHLDKTDAGPTVTKIEILCEASVEGISEEEFKKFADDTKKGCPISRAINAEFVLTAKLV